MAETRGDRDNGRDSGWSDDDEKIRRQMRDELRPILGGRADVVVQRLLLAIAYRDHFSEWAARPRQTAAVRQHQATDILTAWETLRGAIERSEPEIQECLWAGGKGLPPLLWLDRVFDPLRPLAQRSKGGRPTNDRRRLVLDEVVFALAAAGVPTNKTRDGLAEQSAEVVLRLLGEPTIDLHRDVMAAIDRSVGCNNPTE